MNSKIYQVSGGIAAFFLLTGSYIKISNYARSQNLLNNKFKQIFREVEIDSYPIATFYYLKFRNSLQESHQSTKGIKEKIQTKMYKAIKERLINDLCHKYQIDIKLFNGWYTKSSNLQTKEFENKLETAIKDVQKGVQPKTLDYEIKDELKK